MKRKKNQIIHKLVVFFSSSIVCYDIVLMMTNKNTKIQSELLLV